MDVRLYQCGCGKIPKWRYDNTKVEVEQYKHGVGTIPMWSWDYTNVEVEQYQCGCKTIPKWRWDYANAVSHLEDKQHTQVCIHAQNIKKHAFKKSCNLKEIVRKISETQAHKND